ncbi:MAG: nuclear transport factor 2 family protein [Proteobacteria bacterium]|nr:nuclear transport factor 2 family protein [Pseudomonadota bacterium]
MSTINTALWRLTLCLSLLANAPFAAATGLTDARVRAYYAAWSSGKVDEVMTYFAPNTVYEDVATGELATGTAEVHAFATKFLQSSPGVSVEPTSILVGEHSAAVEWTMKAGTGKEAWSVRGVAILQHRDGQILRATDYWDSK